MKLIRVENCGECPYINWSFVDVPYCSKHPDRADINDESILPDFCPLSPGECEWTQTNKYTISTGCGHAIHVWYPRDMAPYCPFCGKKIKEVGDER